MCQLRGDRVFLYSIKAAEGQYFFAIHYYFLLSKNPECEFSEE